MSLPALPPRQLHPGLADALRALHSRDPYTDDQRAADLSLIAAQQHRDHFPDPDLLENIDMARPFSFPAVQALTVGESTDVWGARKIITSKVRAYAKRAGKSFDFEYGDAGFVRVKRVADPVDTGPEAA